MWKAEVFMLICPVCKKELVKEERKYVCTSNHNFDIAKQGYCNLFLKSSQQSGDNKEMVDARNLFLKKGYYEPLAKKLVEVMKKYSHHKVVDAGCGEGYYTNYIQRELGNEFCGFDLSKDAIKIAARNNKENRYFINSIFELPIADHSVDIILNIFAPFAQEEFHRILQQNGIVIKVDPNIKHLIQLKEELYETSYDNEILDLESNCLSLIDYEVIEFDMQLPHEDIRNLLKMTPYYYKSKKDSIERLCALDSLICNASFIIYIYKVK